MICVGAVSVWSGSGWARGVVCERCVIYVQAKRVLCENEPYLEPIKR